MCRNVGVLVKRFRKLSRSTDYLQFIYLVTCLYHYKVDKRIPVTHVKSVKVKRGC